MNRSQVNDNRYCIHPVTGEAPMQEGLCGINRDETHLMAALRITRFVHNLTVQQVFAR